MSDVTKIVSDNALDKEFENTNFGVADQRELVKWCLMKTIGGFSDGYTITCICQDLKLLSKTRNITKKGGRYLWAAFYSSYEAADI
ncbi:MAG: hypothetical protein L3J58_11775 [Emcibacter sp.]|nr:hypothetical protein [Emcibacter sp.]